MLTSSEYMLTLCFLMLCARHKSSYLIQEKLPGEQWQQYTMPLARKQNIHSIKLSRRRHMSRHSRIVEVSLNELQ